MNIKIRRIAASSAPFLSGALAILLAIAIVSSPESSFEASLQGLKLWWTLVFPALLPFLILSEMLTASGFVHGLGVLLEPLMRLIRLPGTGGWTFAVGATTGFPGGALGVMNLHKQGSITDKEAGRLAALAHFGSPVTLLIVVGVALLHSPSAGYVLLAIHWTSGLLASLTASLFYKHNKNVPQSAITKPDSIAARASLHRRVLKAAADAHVRDGRSFGRLLGESVAAAVQNLMITGGYMIMFSVIISIITDLLPNLSSALPAGLLEIHLGAQSISNTITPPLAASGLSEHSGFALLSAALGWSGLCAQLQVLAILKPANVRFLPYAAVRLLHGFYGFMITLLFCKLSINDALLPAFADTGVIKSDVLNSADIWSSYPQLLGFQFLLLALLLLLSGAVYLISKIRRPFG